MRRRRLYDGQLFVYKATPSSAALCEFARQMIEDAFKGLDPRTAQYEMDVESYVNIVAPLKPRFIHSPESKRLIQGIYTRNFSVTRKQRTSMCPDCAW